MALTQTDLQQIREVMDQSIAGHPRFDEMKAEITSGLRAEITSDLRAEIKASKIEVIDEVSELITDVLATIEQRFNIIEHRLDNLRIVTR